MWKITILNALLICLVVSKPQSEQPDSYKYQYEVRDSEKQLFFDKNEIGDASGKITGRYSVWLPDGRLMTVDYSIDGESGFVPKISFAENINPLS